MIDISKLDDKSISFNGRACAAVYKAAAGRDDKGEFVLIAELGGEYKRKLRLEELTIEKNPQRSADAAVSELNRFIGSFKRGGDGGDSEGMASTSYVDSLAYRKLVVADPTLDSGYLIKLRRGEVGGETVVKLIGYSPFGTPIDTVVQFVATAVQGSHPSISTVAGRNFGYEVKNLRLFSMMDDGGAYSLYLWIPTMLFNTHMAVSVFDRVGSVGEPLANLITAVTAEQHLPENGKRFGEVVFTPKGVERQTWSPKIAVGSTAISDAAYTKRYGGFVKDDNRISIDFYIEGTFPTSPKGYASILNLPYESSREMLLNGIVAGYSTANHTIGRIASWSKQLSLYERPLDISLGYSPLSYGIQLSNAKFSIFGDFVYYTSS